ncbi:recE [Rhodococcus hoagii]|nr:recE [Prescottella equi]
MSSTPAQGADQDPPRQPHPRQERTLSNVVDQEGVYDEIPDHVYHSDKGSLSSSGARTLLNKTPAKFRHDQDNPRESTDYFDLGHAAHALVLGYGAPIAEIEAKDWRTKKAQEARDEARAEGKTPLLTADVQRVHAMAAKLREHPLADVLFSEGVPERSMYWRDPETDVWLRSRPDWLPDRPGRLLVTDYKTASTADPRKFEKSALDYGYHQQHAWYVDGITALGVDEDPAFLFVVQEKEPPYLVSVCQLDEDAVELGRRRNREAIDLYAQCLETNTWPGFGYEVHQISLPTWAFN